MKFREFHGVNEIEIGQGIPYGFAVENAGGCGPTRGKRLWPLIHSMRLVQPYRVIMWNLVRVLSVKGGKVSLLPKSKV